MNKKIIFNNSEIGAGEPVYFIAELSANHNQSFERAIELIKAAKEAGADAIKLQTYTADTITIDSDAPPFQVVGGTIWDGKTLYQLYQEAYTPWEWQSDLKDFSESLGLGFLSSPFDSTAVDFLEELNVQIYKIASAELVDIPLLERVGVTQKPVLLSCGMATVAEIFEAIQTLEQAGATGIVLLKCTTAYPCPEEEINLRTLSHMITTFNLPIGLSDHSMGHDVAVAAISLGACVVEKHLTLSRDDGGPDSEFSMEPKEFADMVRAARHAERAIGEVHYGPTSSEEATSKYRKSIFVSKSVSVGEVLTEKNIRSVRPSDGMHTRHYKEVLGKRARVALKKGTPLSWDMIE